MGVQKKANRGYRIPGTVGSHHPSTTNAVFLQCQMLPANIPTIRKNPAVRNLNANIDWCDVVCASLAADEVGGDDIGTTGGVDGSVEVIDEAGLRTGVGLNNGLAGVLVGVVSDPAVDGVVLPVAVEYVLGVHARLVERQLLQLLGLKPARQMFIGLDMGHDVNCARLVMNEKTYLQLANVEDVEVGAGVQDRGEHRAISAAVDKPVVDDGEVHVPHVGVVNDLHVVLRRKLVG